MPIIYVYPILLFVFVLLFTRRNKQLRPLQWVARWLFAIAFAYAMTLGLAIATLSLGYFPYDEFQAFTDDYYFMFMSEGIGLALFIALMGFMVFAVDRLQRSRKRTSSAEELNDGSFKRIAWLLTVLLAINLVFVIFLLIEPYIDFRLNSQAVYHATHNRGLDPRDWFPFAWEGLGGLNYELAFWVWSFGAFFLIPITIVQVSMVKRIWARLQHVERIGHVLSVATSMLAAVFILTIGRSILYWLLD
jgi:hypothetical protein